MKKIHLLNTLFMSLLVSGCSLLTYIENMGAQQNAEIAAQHREELVTDLIQDRYLLLATPPTYRWFSFSLREKLRLLDNTRFKLEEEKGQKFFKIALKKLSKVIDRDIKDINQEPQKSHYQFAAAQLNAMFKDQDERLKEIEMHTNNFGIMVRERLLRVDEQRIAAYLEAHANLLKYLCEVDKQRNE